MLSLTLPPPSPWQYRCNHKLLYADIRIIASVHEIYLFSRMKGFCSNRGGKAKGGTIYSNHGSSSVPCFLYFSYATSPPIFPSARLLDRRNQANKLPNIYHEAAVHARMRKLPFFLFFRGAGCSSVYVPRGISSAKVPGCPSVHAKFNLDFSVFYQHQPESLTQVHVANYH
ncbi:uncharacterized protein EV420DRAFT_1540133 [Desarmillaria tabescens]|uniref:Uncharacterized protein n=1 Tax=Armillaria tabescens TaxID=1929756 RepID=A0AA39KCM4_ARMTA|nr:uncharacterized protein EV420DRAFT_1540133 [Desarmillaria tabescens]KAK0458699.1 hypothetical protein EV420DRAFT_1540133 [Desarmillaria tabescens]